MATRVSHQSSTTVSDAAAELVRDSLVWDMTLPWVPGYSDVDETLQRFHAAGIDVISLTVGGIDFSFREVVDWIGAVTRHIEMRSGQMVLCKSVREIDDARKDGKLALIYNLQETVHFGHRIERIGLL